MVGTESDVSDLARREKSEHRLQKKTKEKSKHKHRKRDKAEKSTKVRHKGKRKHHKGSKPAGTDVSHELLQHELLSHAAMGSTKHADKLPSGVPALVLVAVRSRLSDTDAWPRENVQCNSEVAAVIANLVDAGWHDVSDIATSAEMNTTADEKASTA